MQQQQLVIGQAMENLVMVDLANGVLSHCWDICFDRPLSRTDFLAPTAEKLAKSDACQRKCVARHFEAMTVMNDARELREREAAMGLPPGSLKE